MKKYLYLILLLIITGCSPVINLNKNQTYQEIETTISDDMLIPPDTNMPEDGSLLIENVLKIYANESKYVENDKLFWHKNSKEIASSIPMQKLHEKIECNKDKTDCKITGVLVKKDEIPEGFEVASCNEKLFDIDEGNWCLIKSHKFPINIINDKNLFVVKEEKYWPLTAYANKTDEFAPKIRNKDQILGFYAADKKLYTISISSFDKTGYGYYNYSLYENEKEIFTHKITFGTWDKLPTPNMVLGKPSLTFLDWNFDEENSFTYINISYDGESLYEKYNVKPNFLFGFKDKIGFIGYENYKYHMFFNGQKISDDFDYIYDIKTYENGTLFFLAHKYPEQKYYFVEINLNQYL